MSNVAGIIWLLCFIFFLVPIAIGIFTIVATWKVYKKAGKEGWECIIPIYNIVVLLEITGLPMWYIALLFVPGANIYATVKIYLELAYRFKQSTGFGIGLIFLFPIFIGILAFKNEITYETAQPYAESFCKNCGNKVSSKDKFCTNCGAGIEMPKDICLSCGNKIKEDAKFCTHCGAQL